MKQLITAVDSKVNEQEKKQRLKEVYRYSHTLKLTETERFMAVTCSENTLRLSSEVEKRPVLADELLLIQQELCNTPVFMYVQGKYSILV